MWAHRIVRTKRRLEFHPSPPLTNRSTGLARLRQIQLYFLYHSWLPFITTKILPIPAEFSLPDTRHPTPDTGGMGGGSDSLTTLLHLLLAPAPHPIDPKPHQSNHKNSDEINKHQVLFLLPSRSTIGNKKTARITKSTGTNITPSPSSSSSSPTPDTRHPTPDDPFESSPTHPA